jgi:hypothetical protein
MIQLLILLVCLIILLALEAVWDSCEYLSHNWITEDVRIQRIRRSFFSLVSHSAQLLTFAGFAAFGMYVGYVCNFMRGFNWLAFGYIILAYVLFRISIFNPMYNKMTGAPVLTIGTSNFYDRILNKIIEILQRWGGMKDVRTFETIYGNVMVLCFFLATCAVIGAINNL